MPVPNRPASRNSARASHFGTEALRRRVQQTPPPAEPGAVHPFPVRGPETATEIAVRLRFLRERLERGGPRSEDRSLMEAIAECEHELQQAQEHEGRR